MTSPTSADFVTHHEFELAMARIDSRFDRLEARLEARFGQIEAQMDTRFAQVDTRFALADTRLAEMGTRVAGVQGSLEAQIERAMVASIRWTVGVSFGLYVLMFGLILFVVSRELPHT
jgi:hypothetical protein